MFSNTFCSWKRNVVVKHAQSTSVLELIQKIEKHQGPHALQQDLRQSQSPNPSKKMIQEVGNIELCELLETEPKAQCKTFLSYWNIGIVYCTCGHFKTKKKQRSIWNSLNIRWTFLQSLSMSSVKEDLMEIDMVKSPETKNIIWLTHKRSISKESMTDSYEIMTSAFEWLNILEMKKFVDDGMLSQMKITLTLWQKKNTSITRTNGGFIQMSKVLTLYHWEMVLISSTHCLPRNDCNNKQEKNHRCLLLLTNTNNGSWHRVHHLHGGIGNAHGGLLTIQKVKEEASQILNERSGLVFYSIWQDSSEKYFHEFNLFCYKLIVYNWRRSTVTDGMCKDNTSNDPFSRCKSVQQFGHRWNWRS